MISWKFIKVSAIFKLFNLKAKNRWNDKSFTFLLKLLGDMLQDNNKLLNSTYKVEKILCLLSMKVKRINACPNYYILYRNEYIWIDVWNVKVHDTNRKIIKLKMRKMINDKGQQQKCYSIYW
jgi:hypothetical protein